jgi:hypothetical protein
VQFRLPWRSRRETEFAIGVVLPDRIELSTSLFITLTLSRPPYMAFLRWTIPSP